MPIPYLSHGVLQALAPFNAFVLRDEYHIRYDVNIHSPVPCKWSNNRSKYMWYLKYIQKEPKQHNQCNKQS